MYTEIGVYQKGREKQGKLIQVGHAYVVQIANEVDCYPYMYLDLYLLLTEEVDEPLSQ
jgi:hypothetical protein